MRKVAFSDGTVEAAVQLQGLNGAVAQNQMVGKMAISKDDNYLLFATGRVFAQDPAMLDGTN